MKKIETVAVMGAGAVGSYFLSGLSRKLGENLWAVAEGERKERLERSGITVNGKRLELHVRTPEEARGADLLLVSVKYGSLCGSLEALEKMVDSHTVVMSLLNGVDSEELIGERIGREHMVYSMMKIASERKGDHIVYNPDTTQGVFFGALKGRNQEQTVQAIAELFQGTPVRYTVCEDIIQDIWIKYALNISKNLPQAIAGCGYGAYESSEYMAFLSSRMRQEVADVAAARGICIGTGEESGSRSSKIAPTARFSTLQDLDAGRHTEIDMFSGALIRMGKELGIPTPYNEFAYCMVKALEEKNDGKFAF